MTTREPRASQSDIVVEGIKRMIINGALSAGSRLPVEKDLAAQLGVSRSSLREGVRALVITGVLETRQGDGTYVTALDPGILLSPIGFLVDLHRPENVADLQSVRRVLETEAVGRAALRITDEELHRAEQILASMELLLQAEPIDHEAVMNADITFHRLIAAASHNTTLEALIEAVPYELHSHRSQMAAAAKRDGVVVERPVHQILPSGRSWFPV
jgi:GntR family transcriptional repressor for pyruvate dehydrogenase complex